MDDKEMREMVEDTHRMVKKLYKFEKSRRFWRVLKLIVVVVIIVGAYYAILPVFRSVLETYNNISNGVTNLENFQFPWTGSNNE